MPGPSGANGADGVGADEPRVLLAAPAEARLDRRTLDAEVVAVEVKAHLQAQRVTRAEPRGGRAAAYDLVPQPRCVLGGAEQLDAVLAGVAGSAYEHRGTGQSPARDRHSRRQWR